eukprot:Blabericola_migrator_1__5738@NODE_2909_length_2215_cov_59_305866_g497_i1_p1_GENE_NODE_2909_length_2215_cov_59_305866_g497_i1NODE_2909_length_2215_cov_59_305866_g497_i1_p1_ORF_typecomplete_len457_score109_05ZZ/PF00569_17/2_3e06zfB_box/PF00643_24/0_16_NODE_2909_length_2215_cov_59_305866_g497_i1711441
MGAQKGNEGKSSKKKKVTWDDRDTKDDDASSYSTEDETGFDLTPELDSTLSETLLALANKDKEKLEACKETLLHLHPQPRPTREERKAEGKYTIASEYLKEIDRDDEHDGAEPEEEPVISIDNVPVDQETAKEEIRQHNRLVDESDDDLLTEVPSKREARAAETPGHSRASELMAQYFNSKLQNDDDERMRFLKTYFTKELWKKPIGPTVTVTELDLDDDDDAEEAEEVETIYNHRFQEGGPLIKSYQRNAGDTVNIAVIKENRRARQRQAKRVREQEEAARSIEEAIGGGKRVKVTVEIPVDAEKLIEEDIANGITDDSEWWLCDGCQTLYVRFTCATCTDFALCKACQKDKSKRHEHSLRKSKAPSSAVVPKSWAVAVAEQREEERSEEGLTPLAVAALRKFNRKLNKFKYVEVEPRKKVSDRELWEEVIAEVEKKAVKADGLVGALKKARGRP